MTNKHIELPALSDDEIDDLSWSEFESAMAMGISVDSFKRLAKTVRNRMAAAIAAHEQARVVGEPVARPDILEKLTYHALERDDLTLDECLDFLAQEWRKVHGRTDRQMVMQILSLLAAVAAPVAQPATEQAEAPSDYRKCEFCHCNTNAKMRRCCINGAAADALATQPTASAAGEREAIFALAKKVADEHGDWSVAEYGVQFTAEELLEFAAALASKPPAGEQKPAARLLTAQEVQRCTLGLGGQASASAVQRQFASVNGVRIEGQETAACAQCGGAGSITATDGTGPYNCFACRPHPEPVAPPAREALLAEALSEYVSASKRDGATASATYIKACAALSATTPAPAGQKVASDFLVYLEFSTNDVRVRIGEKSWTFKEHGSVYGAMQKIVPALLGVAKEST